MCTQTRPLTVLLHHKAIVLVFLVILKDMLISFIAESEKEMISTTLVAVRQV